MTRRRRQFQNAAENLRQADLDNIAHFEPRRETVGDLLRRAREGKRLEIAAVVNQSRIRRGYLKAIEEGRFQDLPGLTHAVGDRKSVVVGKGVSVRGDPGGRRYINKKN